MRADPDPLALHISLSGREYRHIDDYSKHGHHKERAARGTSVTRASLVSAAVSANRSALWAQHPDDNTPSTANILAPSPEILDAFRMKSSEATISLATRSQRIADMDLEPIMFKLTQCSEGPGWAIEKAVKVSNDYRRFLVLSLRYSKSSIVPTKEIDTFWHCHILDTAKYAADCEFALGYFLHHFPYLGLRGEEDAQRLQEAFNETRALFQREFAEDFLASSYGSPSVTSETCQVSSCDAAQCTPEHTGDPISYARPSLKRLLEKKAA